MSTYFGRASGVNLYFSTIYAKEDLIRHENLRVLLAPNNLSPWKRMSMFNGPGVVGIAPSSRPG